MENGQALHASPYAVQIEKFADSLTQISHTFMKMEKKKDFFTGEEVDGMFGRVKDGVCQSYEGRVGTREWDFGPQVREGTAE